ncbi:MAG TPA: hypothetical protein VD905_20655 [Flavobacteriales bacterium]|nr:hypothetical protein [Flavobacteriales bacterium]
MFKPALTAFLLVLCLYGSTQVSINSANYNTVSFNETNCLQAIVSNSASSVMAYATVTVKNSGGEIIIEGKTRSFTLNPGINTVSGATVGFSAFTYGNSGKALYLKNNGLLSAGNYSYCLHIIPVGTETDGDVYCEDFEAGTEDFLTLVTPYDKEELDTKLPVLTWSHSEPFNTLAKNEFYKIVVAEIKKDQSAEQAIFSNPAIFSKNFLITHTIPYPMDAAALEDGKHYAWQVQKIANNIIVNKTDVWEFSLKKKQVKPDNKYAVMKQHYDASYYTAVNEHIFFQFDEPYHGSELNFTVYNSKRKEVKADLHNERKNSVGADSPLKDHGNNKYELDLSAYNLKSGYYFLEVLDEKNRKSVLKFFVE